MGLFTYFMANKDDNWLNPVLKIGAAIGGAWLLIEVLKAFGKQETYYSCPKCNADIKYGDKTCRNCKVGLNWDDKSQANG